jgi:plastocyanin
MMRRIFSTVLVFAVAFALAACGGGNGRAAGEEGLDVPTRPDGAHELSIADAGMDPAELTIADGDTVVFVNDDAAAHNLTINFIGIPLVEDQALEPGAEWERAFDEPGEYECMLDDAEEPVAVIRVMEQEPAAE